MSSARGRLARLVPAMLLVSVGAAAATLTLQQPSLPVASETSTPVAETSAARDPFWSVIDNWSSLRASDSLPFSSYANFLIANKVVLVPTFNDPSDRVALSILQEAFPQREVIGIHAVDLVLGLGTIHCLTQQEPE